MKQFVEKQIKDAFESWDNQKHSVGFDKSAVWNSMQTAKKNTAFVITWFRVASIAIILLLLGGLGYSYQINKNLQLSQDQLKTELNQAKSLKTKIAQKKVETKLIYKTQIKTIESEESKIRISALSKKIEQLNAENINLQEQLNREQLANNYLQNSITLMKNNLDETTKWYSQKLKNIESEKQAKGLSIAINQEALMALSNSNTKIKKPSNYTNPKFKISFKNKASESETSASLFKDLTMK